MDYTAKHPNSHHNGHSSKYNSKKGSHRADVETKETQPIKKIGNNSKTKINIHQNPHGKPEPKQKFTKMRIFNDKSLAKANIKNCYILSLSQ